MVFPYRIVFSKAARGKFIRLCQVTIMNHEISLIYKVAKFFKIKTGSIC